MSRVFQNLDIKSDEGRKFLIRRIAARKLNGAVDEDEGQVFRSVFLEKIGNGLGLNEFHRIVRQVIAADDDALPLQGFKHSRQA